MSIMTLTDAESSAESLLAVLNNPSAALDRSGHLAVLRQLKYRLIGHDQRKLAYVNLGLLQPLISILESEDDNPLNLECKTEAAIVIGSLAHANTTLIPLDELCRVVAALLNALHIHESSPKFAHAALRTLNTVYSLPNAMNTDELVAQLQVHTAFLDDLSSVLNAHGTNSAVFTSAASLITKTCPPGDHRWQDKLVETKVLAALVKRLGMLVRRVEDSRSRKGAGVLKFEKPIIVADKGAAAATAMSKASSVVSLMSIAKKVEAQRQDARDPLYVPPAPSTLQIATLLDAISVIVRDNKLRANQCLFAGWITNILGDEARSDSGEPNTQVKEAAASDDTSGETNASSAPSTATMTPGSTFTYRNQEFPPLSPASARHHPPHRSGTSSSLAAAADAAASQLDTDVDIIEPAASTLAFTSETESDPESPLISWLISFIRLDNNPLNRLLAMNLLTDFVRAGCVTKARSKTIAMSIVPILVRLLDETDGSSSASKLGGIATNKLEELEWTIRERAPTILATLVTDNSEMQKAAVDAGAIKRLTGMLRRAFDPVVPESTADGTADGQDSIRMERCKEHKMKVREGSLKALAAIALFEDEYRKMIIDGGAVAFVVGSMIPIPKDMSDKSGDALMSGLDQMLETATNDATLASSSNDDTATSSHIALPPTSAEGNPPAVLIAASYVVRSLSRSVSILRTSLIDYHVSKPLFTLLFHPSIRVRIAATAAICNLVMAFSPMRTGIVEMGVVKVLCDFVKTNPRESFNQEVEALRLNSMWALKHLVLETTLEVKRDCLRGLSPTYLIDLIALDSSTYRPPSGDDMGDHSMDTEDEVEGDYDDSGAEDEVAVGIGKHAYRKHNGIPFSPAAYERISNQTPSAPLTPAQKALLDLQEQALDFIRNLIVPPNSAPMIDSLVTDSDRGDGYDDFYGVMEKKLRSKPHREIIHSIVYILVHIAAAQPHHRDDLIQRKGLFQALNGLFDFPMDQVRSGLSWLGINLTWTEDSNDKEKAKRRIQQLEEYGFVNGLRWLKKCGEEIDDSGAAGGEGGASIGEVMGSNIVSGGGGPSSTGGRRVRMSLDVRERCRQALSQIEAGGS